MSIEELKEDHGRTEEFHEHGQRWLQCLDCGAQWSIEPAVSPRGEEYEEGEEVSHGDESCQELHI